MNYFSSSTCQKSDYSRKTNVLGIGQPMLDLVVHVDKSFLQKYGLQENNAIRATSVHEKMWEEIIASCYDIKKRPGGTTLNTIRIVQKLASKPHTAAFVGSVGDDENGKLISNHLLLDKVSSCLETIKNKPTAKCIVLVEGANRSLVTDLGASTHFTNELFHNPNVQSLIDLAQHYYITMFLAAAEFGPDIMIQTAKFSYRMKRHFMLNIGAPFLVKNYLVLLMNLLEYSDILFGNKDEFVELAKENNLNIFSTVDIGKWASNYVGKEDLSTKPPRIVVITDGENPVYLIRGENLNIFAVPQIHQDYLVDTNGAGDAFVAGFITKFINKENLNSCVEAGIKVASDLIRGEMTLD